MSTPCGIPQCDGEAQGQITYATMPTYIQANCRLCGQGCGMPLPDQPKPNPYTRFSVIEGDEDGS